MILKQPCFADGSHWEIVDWGNFDPRVLGVIWKITQGKYYIDPTCAAFWVGAGKLKLPRSVFHFFEPNDISAQVENFLTACEYIGVIVSGKWMAEFSPVLDAEYSPPTVAGRLLGAVGIETSRLSQRKLFDIKYPDTHLIVNERVSYHDDNKIINVTGAQLAAQYKAWLDLVEAEVKIKPIIYTSKWFWMHTGYPAWASEYELWDAQYPYNPDGQDYPLYVPYGNWTREWAWQYSASAVLRGVTGYMDVNVYNGTIEEWNQKYGGVVPPEPPTSGETMLIAHNPNALSLRNAPVVSSATFIKTMPANTHIEGTEIVTAADGSKWLHATVPQIGYCASWLLVYETPLPTPTDVTSEIYANGTMVHSAKVPAGGKVRIDVTD